jgi:hypothetical protein
MKLLRLKRTRDWKLSRMKRELKRKTACEGSGVAAHQDFTCRDGQGDGKNLTLLDEKANSISQRNVTVEGIRKEKWKGN